MLDKFEAILIELGKDLDLELTVDKHQSCTILVDDKLEVQLELDDREERLLVLSYACKVPPGKFRENVFNQALKQNDKIDRLANFAYSEISNQLIIFKYLPLEQYSSDKITDFLAQFIDFSLLYKNAIEAGYDVPQELKEEGEKSNPFGIK